MRAGIIVNSLGMSQMSFELTTQLNKLNLLDEYWDIILFYRTYDKFIKPPAFAMINEEEAWGYDAPCMATDLRTAECLINSPGPTKKLFYVWELEWLYKIYDVDYLNSIYLNPHIELVARSESNAKIIENCWKTPIEIIEGFNYGQLTNIFRKYTGKL